MSFTVPDKYKEFAVYVADNLNKDRHLTHYYDDEEDSFVVEHLMSNVFEKRYVEANVRVYKSKKRIQFFARNMFSQKPDLVYFFMIWCYANYHGCDLIESDRVAMEICLDDGIQLTIWYFLRSLGHRGNQYLSVMAENKTLK